jgi:Sulfotransferase family
MDPAGSLPPPESYERYFAHCRGEDYALEATPSYCYGGERVLRAIHDTLADPRIIIILRDPVDRLVSAYRFQRGRENLGGIESFDEYVAASEEQHRRTAGVPGPSQGHLKGYSIGFYGRYVPQWLDLFEDRARVVFFEDLQADPRALVAGLCRWLSIDEAPAQSFDYAVRNKTVNPRSAMLARAVFVAKRRFDRVVPRGSTLRKSLRAGYRNVNSGRPAERIDPATRRRVAERYAESNRAVADALRSRGYDPLPAWLTGDPRAAGPPTESTLPVR